MFHACTLGSTTGSFQELYHHGFSTVSYCHKRGIRSIVSPYYLPLCLVFLAVSPTDTLYLSSFSPGSCFSLQLTSARAGAITDSKYQEGSLFFITYLIIASNASGYPLCQTPLVGALPNPLSVTEVPSAAARFANALCCCPALSHGLCLMDPFQKSATHLQRVLHTMRRVKR